MLSEAFEEMRQYLSIGFYGMDLRGIYGAIRLVCKFYLVELQ
jgi:hypothetical protein